MLNIRKKFESSNYFFLQFSKAHNFYNFHKHNKTITVKKTSSFTNYIIPFLMYKNQLMIN